MWTDQQSPIKKNLCHFFPSCSISCKYLNLEFGSMKVTAISTVWVNSSMSEQVYWANDVCIKSMQTLHSTLCMAAELSTTRRINNSHSHVHTPLKIILNVFYKSPCCSASVLGVFLWLVVSLPNAVKRQFLQCAATPPETHGQVQRNQTNYLYQSVCCLKLIV